MPRNCSMVFLLGSPPNIFTKFPSTAQMRNLHLTGKNRSMRFFYQTGHCAASRRAPSQRHNSHKCSTRVLAKGKRQRSSGVYTPSYGKIACATQEGPLWRDGRAAEGACLENMFGESQRGFESHSLRCELQVNKLKVRRSSAREFATCKL